MKEKLTGVNATKSELHLGLNILGLSLISTIVTKKNIQFHESTTYAAIKKDRLKIKNKTTPNNKEVFFTMSWGFVFGCFERLHLD